MSTNKNKFGIIGCGNMGSAIAERIKTEYPVWVFDRDKNKISGLSGVNISGNILDLAAKVNVIILAVKPQDFDEVLSEVKAAGKNKLIISIAAGITTAYIERILGSVRVIRAMPNIGIKIGHSVTCICKGKFAEYEDLDLAKRLFAHIGEVQDLNEEMMDAATAISGSGPGYYFDAVVSRSQEYRNNPKKFHDDFISSLTEAAKSIGFDQQQARLLAHWTVVYSDLLLGQTKLPPQELRSQVTSKGGTTEAALEVLHKGGSLTEAVKAALKRAKELSRG